MKREARKLRKYCINEHRIDYDKREQIPLEYLSHPSLPRYFNNLEMVKSAILCMDESHANYEHLSPEKKGLVQELLEHNDVVDIVMCTIFQWIGTTVGSCDVGDIIKEVNSIDHLGKKLKRSRI